MVSPLRIARHDLQRVLDDKDSREDQRKEYIDRLLKLIPVEVVALYVAGKNAILMRFATDQAKSPSQFEYWAWVGWTVVCLGGVIWARSWLTSDKAAGVPVEKAAVAIAGVSFLVWVYSFGDVFNRVLGVWDSLLATLLVLLWTFAAPYFYSPNKK